MWKETSDLAGQTKSSLANRTWLMAYRFAGLALRTSHRRIDSKVVPTKRHLIDHPPTTARASTARTRMMEIGWVDWFGERLQVCCYLHDSSYEGFGVFGPHSLNNACTSKSGLLSPACTTSTGSLNQIPNQQNNPTINRIATNTSIDPLLYQL